ncbi:BTAD domain-containing putative transcriptional regulator [Kitasatospora sp. NBC_00315]|uniref:AfsR/SARP family transcriptional regulator n=1 Tax=Kitasatospora sp. NBC_00315 TaxID=2975963 RepID=UPI003254E9D6
MIARLLGPLDVRVNGFSIVPTAPKPRKVLALLVVHANRVVGTSTLMRELWREEPPHSSATTLQTYILLLRKLLAEAHGGDMHAAKQQLATYPGGYMLRMSGDAVDLYEFDRLCVLGRQQLGRRENEAASRTLRRALDMWQGNALVDVRLGPILDVEVSRLEESCLGALEQRIEADLRLGRHHELVSELTALTRKFPLYENLHAQLMLALYRSGRKASALEAYHQLRANFVDELGLEPSARMSELHSAILASRSTLDVSSYPRPLLLDNFEVERSAVS